MRFFILESTAFMIKVLKTSEIKKNIQLWLFQGILELYSSYHYFLPSSFIRVKCSFCLKKGSWKELLIIVRCLLCFYAILIWLLNFIWSLRYNNVRKTKLISKGYSMYYTYKILGRSIILIAGEFYQLYYYILHHRD